MASVNYIITKKNLYHYKRQYGYLVYKQFTNLHIYVSRLPSFRFHSDPDDGQHSSMLYGNGYEMYCLVVEIIVIIYGHISNDGRQLVKEIDLIASEVSKCKVSRRQKVARKCEKVIKKETLTKTKKARCCAQST